MLCVCLVRNGNLRLYTSFYLLVCLIIIDTTWNVCAYLFFFFCCFLPQISLSLPHLRHVRFNGTTTAVSSLLPVFSGIERIEFETLGLPHDGACSAVFVSVRLYAGAVNGGYHRCPDLDSSTLDMSHNILMFFF